MKKKEYQQWAKKLKKYWLEHRKLESDFNLAEARLEAKMLKETGRDLIFFYGEMNEGCAGIGADKYEERKDFNLIHDLDLEEI